MGSMSVIVDRHGELYALLVDDVGDVLWLPASLHEAAPATLSLEWRSLCSGLYRLETELLLVLRIEEIAEHVHAAPFVLRGELHPRDERHPEGDGGISRLGPSGGTVMIGERERAHPVRVRLRDHLGGRLRAIGMVGVQVQVGGTGEPVGRSGHPMSVPSVARCRRRGARRRMSRQGLHRRRS